jgi:XTP/dITP diphosphohydrolase
LKIQNSMRLIFASNNLHKLEEVRKILSAPIEVVGLSDIGFLQEIDESGTTLEANSHIKADVVWQWLVAQSREKDYDGVFADDTGLEINALGGKPGVYSARWAGEPANDANNRKKVLSELEGVSDRTARFRTVITWITPTQTIQVEGIVEGEITCQEEGTGGFGYDAIFRPKGYANTFAVLSPETKNNISHRARALMALRDAIDKR